MYVVYCHVFPNGKRYIGITRTGLQRRWGKGNNYKSCTLVDRAIEKYGWENVRHVILDFAKAKVEAEEKERYYISLFQTTNPEKGYNILPGGNVADNPPTAEMRVKLGHNKCGKHHTAEQKEKIRRGVKEAFKRPESNGHFGMHHTLEARKKMSDSQKARWDDELRAHQGEMTRQRMSDPVYKKKIIDNLAKYRRKPGEWSMPQSTKDKLSVTNRGRWRGENSPTSKPVIQLTKEGVFVKRWASAGEAERAGIADLRNIHKCCRHSPHCYTAGGYRWEFATSERITL